MTTSLTSMKARTGLATTTVKLVARLLVLVTMLVVAGVGLTAGPANADTKSCQFYGGGSIGGQSVPGGTYCATRVGSGTWVSGVQGEFYGPKLCNYDVTAEFFDNRWGWKRTFVSRHNYGCAYGSTWMPYIGVNNSMAGLTGTSTGYMCSTLRAGWQRVTSSCQYIY